MFYFQNLFNTALNGIDAGGATAGVVQVAQFILMATLLFGIFQAWAQGGVSWGWTRQINQTSWPPEP